MDLPKRLGVARLELYLGREPRKVQVPGVFSGSDQVQAHTVGYLCAFALCWITSFYPTKKKKNLLQVQVNKKNLMKFSFNSIYYLYNYYMVCVLLFHGHHVMSLCDILTCDCDIYYVTLFYTYCKGTSPSQPLNSMTTLRSYLSLFTSDT